MSRQLSLLICMLDSLYRLMFGSELLVKRKIMMKLLNFGFSISSENLFCRAANAPIIIPSIFRAVGLKFFDNFVRDIPQKHFARRSGERSDWNSNCLNVTKNPRWVVERRRSAE
jgi:hypothetical protein